MTTKFEKMATKKLQALLSTANDEDKVLIQQELERRNQPEKKAKLGLTEYESEEPLTAEEQALIDEAEKNGGKNPLYNEHKKAAKLTDEQRHELAETLKANINHRCQAVPFNTAEWVNGYIAGVIEEKRTNKVLYAIKTDDGRRIVKVHDSNLVRIFDEIVEVQKTVRTRTSSKVEKSEWTPEMIADEVNAVIENVGKKVTFVKYETVDADGNKQSEMAEGRIVAIVPDKRAQRILYRILVEAPTESNPNGTKTVHKVAKSEGLNIAEEFDAEGQELNAKYRGRREASATRSPLTIQDRVARCEENLKKAEERLAMAKTVLETKKQQLEEAKAELEAFLKAQTEAAPEGEDLI